MRLYSLNIEQQPINRDAATNSYAYILSLCLNTSTKCMLGYSKYFNNAIIIKIHILPHPLKPRLPYLNFDILLRSFRFLVPKFHSTFHPFYFERT